MSYYDASIHGYASGVCRITCSSGSNQELFLLDTRKKSKIKFMPLFRENELYDIMLYGGLNVQGAQNALLKYPGDKLPEKGESMTYLENDMKKTSGRITDIREYSSRSAIRAMTRIYKYVLGEREPKTVY